MKVINIKNMAKKEVQEEIQDEALEETTEEVVTDVNAFGNAVYTKATFKELMEKYKKQNPKKYAMKEKALEATLKTLK